MAFEVLTILALILANGLLAGAEIAVVSVRKSRLQALLAEKRGGARALTALRRTPENFLATVQIGITVIGTAAGAFGGSTLARHLEPLLARLPFIADKAHDVALVFVVSLISYLSLVLGELVPKSLALRAAEPYALWVSGLLMGLSWLMRPLVWILTASSNVILRPFRDRTTFAESRFSRDELRTLVDEAAKTGDLDEQTGELASRAFEFEELTAADVMVPRNRITAIALDADNATIRRCLLEERRSRIPVYDGSLDNVVGYVTATDVLPLAWENRLFVLADILRPVRVYIETTSASQLLHFMRRERQRLAILVDEHGATAGLVTFEDLVEELVGEVMTEHDRGSPPLQREPAGTLIARGDVPLRDVERALAVDLAAPKGINTVAGLCIALAGGVIPQRGARLAASGGFVLEVLEASARAVRRARLSPSGR